MKKIMENPILRSGHVVETSHPYCTLAALANLSAQREGGASMSLRPSNLLVPDFLAMDLADTYGSCNPELERIRRAANKVSSPQP